MRWILCLTMLVSLGFAPAPVYRPGKDSRSDLEKLQGTWQSTSCRCGGRTIEMVTTWKFRENDLDVHHKNGAIGETVASLQNRVRCFFFLCRCKATVV